MIKERHFVPLRRLPLKLLRVKRLIGFDQDRTAVRTKRVQDLAVVSLTTG